jgi:hypothetical protein
MQHDLPWGGDDRKRKDLVLERQRQGWSDEDIAASIATAKPRRKKAASACPLEHDEQKELIKAVDGAWGKALGIAGELVSVPNSAPKGHTAAAYFRAEGLRPGYPDLLLDVPVGKYHGLLLELKRQRGGRIEPDEAKWHEILRARGFAVAVPCGCDAAKVIIERYMRGEVIP